MVGRLTRDTIYLQHERLYYQLMLLFVERFEDLCNCPKKGFIDFVS